ncbi:hypothetical protein O9431_02610 [Proteus mirabilis]|uniref:hypothetical protein n=1 Tax=Morganellaceae TaxID=1903414 RepID=UPI00137673C4|nr:MULTISPECIES: hypothetical protein [Proteus]MDL2140654.1 hypothetical protein [Proteus mirabilis]MDM3744647.1 hypothetical protein [Proteus mirabilis]NBM98895.1 hypothetical protein [Proteus sp. G4465]NBN06260.1 hypothetical protein [Proteus sp. G4463]
MGSYAYDYLNDSLLLDGALVSQLYQGISDLILERELTRYREYCLKILPEVRKDVKASNDALSCMATDTMSHISRLKQAALYLEEAIVSDPIFKLTDFRSASTEAITSFMGVTSTPMIDRRELANAAIRLIELRPLVVGGYVKLYPVSFELERGEEIPLLYSNKGFEDCLPSNILKQYKTNADVRSVQNDNGRMLVMRDLYLCRNISIHFKGMEGGFVMGYMLNPTEIKPTNKENVYTFIQKKSSEPPSKEDFVAWVRQSVNQTARNHYIDLNKRIALCEYLGCMFGTEHPFESNLLNMNFDSSDIKANTLNCTLQMDVPFLEQISSADLMSIRNNDGEAFQSFRSELERGLRQARHESDPSRVRAIIEDTQHELFEVQMSQIAPQVSHIKKTHLTEVAIATAGLGLSVLTGGTSLLATAIAVAHGYKSHSDYKSKVTANPCHFLWNVKMKAEQN